MLNDTGTVESRRTPARAKPKVVSIVAVDGRDDAALLALAANLATSLETPIAAAIVESAREREIEIAPVQEFHHATAMGVAGTVGDHRVVLGNAEVFRDLQLSVNNLGDWPERLQQRGEQVLFVAVDGRTAGFIGVAEIRSDHEIHMEDEMQAVESTVDQFPARAEDLPATQSVKSIELAAGAEFELRIAPVAKRLGDATVRMLAYNESVPGPTLRVKQGSEVLVKVVNEGDLETTVHWHGLRVDNQYDGTLATQDPIPVGSTFTYRLSFPDAGIYWYHPHIREDYGQEMGLYGNIIVTPSDREYWSSVNREFALTLDDILIEEGKVAPFNRTHPTYTAMGRFGNTLLANGEIEPAIDVRQGEVVRLYLTNTANTRVFNIAIPGARMKLVGGDSGRYERETFVEQVLIAPSERAVVDVLFQEPGRLTLEHRTPHRTYSLATFAVAPDRTEPSYVSEFWSLRVNSEFADARTRLSQYVDAPPDKTLSLVAEMDMGEPDLSAGEAVAYYCPMHPEIKSAQAGRCPKCGMKLVPANLVQAADAQHGHDHAHSDQRAADVDIPAGIEWEDDMVEANRMTNPSNMRWKLIDRQTGAEGAAIDWRFDVGDMVKIRLVNEMDSDHPMHHPFHVHGAGRFLILSRDGVAESNLVWKDTVLVPTGQTVDILLEVTHPGVWMAHCHIAEHHESGMMLHFRVDSSVV